ncbi:ABC transporter permease [Maledivibacter halophilus]|uniref:Peptide/nickel transport system permease protein n=1 Tax=Maledivibacter halophilus TaxID=36842 RepID=A0A1T5M8Q8_9FIRM|nr:ABC transporter permease [Maledivibacter halophilus]SKC84483.1 peptide/nickel transport system permease protein [Maledivibacter halophilus]
MNDSPFKEFLSSCYRNRNFMIGFIIILSVIISAIFASQIASFNYDEVHPQNILAGPSVKYIFGTDNMGRDLFSRIIYGSKITLQVAILGAGLQLIFGVIIGLICGYFGGLADRLLTFVADLTWCIPGMIMALAVVTVIGSGLTNAIIAIAVVNWASYARMVRAKTMSIKNQAFIETGISFGENPISIMFRYILPNIVPVLIVTVSMQLPRTIMSTTTLSFLGVGSQPPSPDWGLMVSEGINFISRGPWLCIFPGLALVYTVFGFNILGEGLRDLLDPRMKSQ